MNPKDLKNLEFLMTASTEQLKEWWRISSEEDHQYAEELLKSFAEEMNNAAIELIEPTMFGEFIEARQVLSRFTLKRLV